MRAASLGSFRQNFAGNAVTDYTLAYLEEALKVKVHPRFLVSERKGIKACTRAPLDAP